MALHGEEKPWGRLTASPGASLCRDNDNEEGILMSSYSTLTQQWLGKSREQITESWQPPSQAKDFDKVIASQRSGLANAILIEPRII